jgi:aminopeptidase C
MIQNINTLSLHALFIFSKKYFIAQWELHTTTGLTRKPRMFYKSFIRFQSKNRLPLINTAVTDYGILIHSCGILREERNECH